MTRIATTHVGSLPRSQEVVDLIFAREREEPYDQSAFDASMARAVSETVARQKEAGIDIVSDGETSKISYATYVKDRYTGFSGDSPRNAPADLKMFPGFLKRLADDGGTPQYARPMCTGAVTSKGQGELQKDITNLKAHVIEAHQLVLTSKTNRALGQVGAERRHIHPEQLVEFIHAAAGESGAEVKCFR